MQTIYLDHNSTTPIDPRVVDAMNECHGQRYMNPASQHRMGQAARGRLEQLRSEIIEMLGGCHRGMHADRLVFTSGGTEANNLAVAGLVRDPTGNISRNLVLSRIEHPSVTGVADQLSAQGVRIGLLNVDRSGVVQLDQLETQLAENDPAVVSLMMANNETGVIQPVAQCVAICRQYQTLVHTDAVQAIGKIPVDFSALSVDTLTLTAHKFHGPRGIGGILMKHDCVLSPLLFGGFQQMGIRPGTEDVVLVTGLHRALQLATDSLLENQQRMASMRDRLESRIIAECEGATVIGGDVDRVPHTLNVAFPGIDRQAFLLAADMRGLAVSTGSACASGSSEPSPVLMSMGIQSELVESSIRLSLGRTTTLQEINLAADRICLLCNSLRR